ncbi:hypothetical protein ACFYT4_31785 [Streptomyces sp. NPDC004609]|uniref:hypothetical protein n=1 Tax=Streptomyces sp. NPDC004609 TaxID=3364704 RepID=UPI0036BE4116
MRRVPRFRSGGAARREPRTARLEVRDWKADDFLKSSDDDIATYLVDKYSIACPMLRPEDKSMLEPHDTYVVVEDFAGRWVERLAILLTFVVPLHRRERGLHAPPSYVG